ncbi:MAG: sodium:alanine symporter family protein, partial [Nitrospinae bacterium]|nr:sodium:alanine symporter family protein [Nitrospinota bacterium]
MDIIASWIWNPFLSIIYIEVGILFLVLTGALAWKKGFQEFLQILKSDKEVTEERHISHTKAFITSLAATVGVGNLAGVGTAIHLGGPGALFWMWISALLGMTFRMTSTYMSLKDQPESVDSPLFATPMSYLEKYAKGSWSWIPLVVAGLIISIGLVMGNLIQSNSVAYALNGEFGISKVIVAVVLAGFVALVILGGLQSIVSYSTKIAPWMMLIYVGAGLILLFSQPLQAMQALWSVFYYAFNPWSAAGGVAGYTIMQTIQFGISRGIFSHGSGIGIAPFLQSANRDHPATGAYMAALVPFFDTIVICTITALVILTGNHWLEETGAYLTVYSFESFYGKIGGLTVIFCLVIFAFTTIISWSHYAERCFGYLGGKNVM